MGAWWPPRSSKPLRLSVPGSGWFNSFPLRHSHIEIVTTTIFGCSARISGSNFSASAHSVPKLSRHFGRREGKQRSTDSIRIASAHSVPKLKLTFQRLRLHQNSTASIPTVGSSCHVSEELFGDGSFGIANLTGMDVLPDDPAPTELQCEAPALMTKQELAGWLNVCVKTIDNWLLEGWLPVIQPSPRIQRFNPTQILVAMEELHGRGHGYNPRNRQSVKTPAI